MTGSAKQSISPQKEKRGLLRRCAPRNDEEAGMTMLFNPPPSASASGFRRLAAGFHLPISPGAALAIDLRAALHGERIVGDVFRDDRARTDIGALADLHRRHQR